MKDETQKKSQFTEEELDEMWEWQQSVNYFLTIPTQPMENFDED